MAVRVVDQSGMITTGYSFVTVCDGLRGVLGSKMTMQTGKCRP